LFGRKGGRIGEEDSRFSIRSRIVDLEGPPPRPSGNDAFRRKNGRAGGGKEEQELRGGTAGGGGQWGFSRGGGEFLKGPGRRAKGFPMGKLIWAGEMYGMRPEGIKGGKNVAEGLSRKKRRPDEGSSVPGRHGSASGR